MADSNTDRKPIRWQQVALGVGLILVVDSAAAWVIWPSPLPPKPVAANRLQVRFHAPPELPGPELVPGPREVPVVERMLGPREVFEPADPQLLAALRERLRMAEVAPPPARTDAELRDLLLRAPEVGLDASQARLLGRPGKMPLDRFASWPAVRDLPFLSAAECRLDREDAACLDVLSRRLRTALTRAAEMKSQDAAAEAVRLEVRAALRYAENHEAVLHVLMAEGMAMRWMLVDELARAKGRPAGEALARLALFDLSAEVRDHALNRLSRRDRAEYRHVWLAAFRHSWPAAADHAAVALVRVRDRAAVPFLAGLAEGPDPRAPRPDRRVSELVRVNRLRNCYLCHAPSQDGLDPVRGLVPEPGQPLAPPDEHLLYEGGTLVRADVTFLRAEFAAALPVALPGRWPPLQPFDFLVRTRPATPDEMAAEEKKPAGATSPQRQAILYAIQELERE